METIRAEISQLADQVDACRQQYTEAGNTVARASRWQFQSLRDAASRARQEQAESATNGLIHQQLLVQELGNVNVKELPPRIIQALEFQFTGASMPEIENEVNALRVAFFSGRAAPLTPVQRGPPKPNTAKKQGLLDGWVSTSAPKDLPEKQKQPVLLKTPTAGTARLTPPTPATLSRPQSSSVSLSKGPTNIAKPLVPAKRRQDPEERSPLAPIDGNRRKSARLSKLPAKDYGVQNDMPVFEDHVSSHVIEKDLHDDEYQDGSDQDSDTDIESIIWDSEDENSLSDDEISDELEVIVEPRTDERGFIHVGGQPMEPRPHIVSAPTVHGLRLLGLKFWHTYQVDRKFLAKPHAAENFMRLRAHLANTLSEHGDGQLKRYCDYTGIPTSWISGPRAYSLEAVHPFAVMGGESMYHAYPNVVMVMEYLNRGKYQWPIVLLPLIGEAIRLNNATVDFATLKSRWTWLYNALTNVMILAVLFKLRQHRKSIVQKLGTWTMEYKRACLEVLRTGSLSPIIQEELEGKTQEELFQHRGCVQENYINWTNVYQELLGVAEREGDLSPSEFDFYLTIPHPSGQGRVFYPYHILTQPQVILMGWDWDTIYGITSDMAYTTKSECNKHAEKAGLGENLDGLKVMFGLCAILSDRIKQAKLKRPLASRDEIAFRLFENWGFPIVPFKLHPLAASLGHQVHGTAMFYGFTNGPDQDFDPQRHIDLSRCTVSLEAQFTNRAKWNFHNDYYKDMQRDLSMIPLHHPYYRVDKAMGDRVWTSPVENSDEPIAPVPEFETELLPIGLWVPDSNEIPEIPLPEFNCHQCGISLSSAGSLIHHYRSHHGTSDTNHEDASQEEADAEYWGSLICEMCGKSTSSKKHLKEHKLTHLPDDEKPKFVCQICGKVSHTKSSLQSHEMTHLTKEEAKYECPICHKKFKQQTGLGQHIKRHITKDSERTYKCDIDGCSKDFLLKEHLASHKRTVHGEKTHVCDFEGCNYATTTRPHLEAHQKIHAQGRAREFFCDVEGCDKSFLNKQSVEKHKREFHDDKIYRCDFDGCEKAYSTPQLLEIHEASHVNLLDRKFVCEICRGRFATKKALKRHIKAVHETNDHLCDYDGCDESFNTKKRLEMHKRASHGEDTKRLMCDVCGKAATTVGNLNAHKREVHGEKTHHCDVESCGLSFTSANRLKQHKKATHSENTGSFVCDVCGKSFKGRPNLYNHKRNAHGDKAHHCDFEGCEEVFTSKSKLDNHKKEVHPRPR